VLALSCPSQANTIRARSANAAGKDRDPAIGTSSARSPSVKTTVVVRVYPSGMRHLQECLTPCTLCAYELMGQDTSLDMQSVLRVDQRFLRLPAHRSGKPC